MRVLIPGKAKIKVFVMMIVLTENNIVIMGVIIVRYRQSHREFMQLGDVFNGLQMIAFIDKRKCLARSIRPYCFY